MGIYDARTFDFKARDSDEFEGLDTAFAIKEYLQNSVGQILKALQVRIWRNWDREDLLADTAEGIQQRQRCKESLIQETPQIFAGDQGLYLKKCPQAQPSYVLRKCIDSSDVRGDRYPHDLLVLVVLWQLHLLTLSRRRMSRAVIVPFTILHRLHQPRWHCRCRKSLS